jgi:hypothetical protein
MFELMLLVLSLISLWAGAGLEEAPLLILQHLATVEHGEQREATHAA